MPKATVSASAKTEQVTAVKVSASVLAAIKSAITADIAKLAAVTTSEQSIVKAGLAIRDGNFGSRQVADVSVRPLIVTLYKEAGKDPLYAGQQIARMLNIAFPGGKKPASDAAAKKAKENLEAALKSGAKVNSNDLQKIATGTARFDAKKKEVIKLETTPSRARTTKTPLETMTEAIQFAITAANTAQLDAEQVMNVVVATLITCKMVDDADEARDLIK